jgi:hypothetical protein
MIRFFRSIRQSLLAQGRIKRYLTYAVGEILLVVIGILIALQVNNWNERSRTEAQVQGALFALRDDLVQDTMLISVHLPEVIEQHRLNESLRHRIARPEADLDTLIRLARQQFNPNWTNPVSYNTNAYGTLNAIGLLEHVRDPLRTHIKNFYNEKARLGHLVDRATSDYRSKVASYVDTYSFGSTALHDQGPLIDSLIWSDIDPAHLAARFQGISNFKRILFTQTKDELEYSRMRSTLLITEIDNYLNEP